MEFEIDGRGCVMGLWDSEEALNELQQLSMVMVPICTAGHIPLESAGVTDCPPTMGVAASCLHPKHSCFQAPKDESCRLGSFSLKWNFCNEIIY